MDFSQPQGGIPTFFFLQKSAYVATRNIEAEIQSPHLKDKRLQIRMMKYFGNEMQIIPKGLVSGTELLATEDKVKIKVETNVDHIQRS